MTKTIHAILISIVLISGIFVNFDYAKAVHPETGTGEIHGLKFNDLNGNGIRDAGEPPVAGVAINATLGGISLHETVTDINGNYNFTGLESGLYTIHEEPPPFFVQTFPDGDHIVVLADDETRTGVDFGNHLVGPGQINGTKWLDADSDGVFDAGESGVQGVSITLWKLTPPDTSGSFTGFTTTDINGDYGFSNLEPGFYRVEENTPFGSTQTFPANGQDQFVEVNGNIIENVDFGNHIADPGQIKGSVWNDDNENGVRDAGETGLSFREVCLSETAQCTFTNSVGDYTFFTAPAGTYSVYVQLTPTSLNTTPISQTVTVSSNQIVENVDFGISGGVSPPPPEVEVVDASPYSSSGLPTIYWGEDTTYRKNVGPNGFDHCGTDKPVQIKLVVDFPQSGSSFEQLMTEVDPTNEIWETTFPPFSPAHGLATLTFYVDCPADTPSFPEDTGLIAGEDEIQKGGSIYVDPSGKILNQCTGEFVEGATAILKVESPPNSGNFVIPPSTSHIPDVNPQVTGSDGQYGWVVIPGNYKVTVLKDGFTTNESAVVTIPPAVTELDIFITPVDGCTLQLQEQKEEIIIDLQSELPTGDKKSDKKLEKAITHITKSLDDKFWIDDSTLDPKDGHKVFGEEKKSVKRLLKVDAIDVSGIIDSLVTIDAQLALDAISEAEQFAGDPKVDKELEKANKELEKAQKELDNGRPDKSIDHYKKAWKHAQKAIDFAT